MATSASPARPIVPGAISSTSEHPLFVQAAPLVFVFIWSTGFIGARYGLPYAEPFTYLALRMVLAASLMTGPMKVARSSGASMTNSSRRSNTAPSSCWPTSARSVSKNS